MRLEPDETPLPIQSILKALHQPLKRPYEHAPYDWIYLPNNVSFAATNTQPCSMPGWLGHSRQIIGWGNDPDPIAGWVAHVRGVIGEAT